MVERGVKDVTMSVWMREIDLALKTLAETVVKVYDGLDKDKNPVYKSVPVVIRTPEKEFVIESFPCVSIVCYNQVSSSERTQDTGYYVSDIDLDTGVQTVREAPQNWDLFYQVDIWAEYQEDLVEMTRRWTGNTGAHFSLSVVDTEGTTQECPASFQSNANLDSITENERRFRRSYSYKIWAQLDEKAPRECVAPIVELRRV